MTYKKVITAHGDILYIRTKIDPRTIKRVEELLNVFGENLSENRIIDKLIQHQYRLIPSKNQLHRYLRMRKAALAALREGAS